MKFLSRINLGQKIIIFIGLSTWFIWYLPMLLSSNCEPKNFSGSPSYVCITHNFIEMPFAIAIMVAIPTVIFYLFAVIISKYIKINRIKNIIVGALAIFLATFYIMFFFGAWELASPIFTDYTPGFSYEKFYNIQKGITQEEVNSVLGEPFTKSDGKQTSTVPCDWYSRPKNSWSNFLGWVSVRVCYDKENKANNIIKDVFFN